jgi:hypothetical protein
MRKAAVVFPLKRRIVPLPRKFVNTYLMVADVGV